MPLSHFPVFFPLLAASLPPPERVVQPRPTLARPRIKVADRLLQLLGLEREYIQLHRDTSLQSLTLTPSLEQGRIEWHDSPLVRGMLQGRVVVIDEADKVCWYDFEGVFRV